MKKKKSFLKSAVKLAPVALTAFDMLSLALSKHEEKQGNYSREFSDVEEELKQKIDEVRNGYVK